MPKPTERPLPLRATLFDVAKLVGVSIQTVSAVVNDKPGISAATRQRVRQAAIELDYRPNILASSLRARKSLSLGVLVSSITNTFFPEFVRGVEDVAHANGYSLFLCNSDSRPEKELTYLQLLRQHAVAGLIAAYEVCAESRELLIDLIDHGTPVVTLGRERIHPRAVTLDSSDEAGGYLAGQHLFSLGHQRIGVICPPRNQVGLDRMAGFARAFRENGRPFADEYWVEGGGFEFTHGQIGMERLASLPELPTAILAANDLVAIGAAHVLHKLGYQVPADVSVVGYDDIRMAELFNPPLTTIVQPMYQLGETARRALLRRWAKAALNGSHKTFHPKLVVRESTAARRRDKQTSKTTNRRTPYA